MPGGQALVLGGGGQDVTGADLLVGTSAGAAVAAQVGSGLSPDALFARQVEPALQAREISAELDMEKFAAEFGALLTGITSAESAQETQRRVGAFALAARTVPEAERRAAVGSRLPSPDWPSRRMLLVAVDAETGQTRVFDRQSGVELIDAVAASCAVPGVWPPVSIGGRRYGEAAALDSLGYAHQHLGDYASGAARCREALTVFHALGDPYNQASVTPMPASCRKSCGPRWPVRRCGRRTVPRRSAPS